MFLSKEDYKSIFGECQDPSSKEVLFTKRDLSVFGYAAGDAVEDITYKPDYPSRREKILKNAKAQTKILDLRDFKILSEQDFVNGYNIVYLDSFPEEPLRVLLATRLFRKTVVSVEMSGFDNTPAELMRNAPKILDSLVELP